MLGLLRLEVAAKKVKDQYDVIKDLDVLVGKLINNFKPQEAPSATGRSGPSHLFNFMMKLSPAGVQVIYTGLEFRDAATVNAEDARYLSNRCIKQGPAAP